MPSTTGSIPTRLLVIGMIGEGGTVRAGDVYPVAEACGQSAEQVRSCLRRLVSEGLFDRHGSGRDAVYRLTPSGQASLGTRLRRVRMSFAQDAAGRG